ncbi:MAG: response regulator transcription factor [Rothia sp. (in: high G+C Gram-positive bacteria)]|nr:response regulator transcription factor [Rothia sp. (in: high G+C Gram-positive bacteria)]
MRIILAEDSALLREGLKMVLAALGHEVVAEAADAPGLLEAVQAMASSSSPGAPLSPALDAVVTDVRMPPTHTSDGLKAALQLRETYPELPILVLSQYITTAYARELFASGAAGLGYLLKDRVGDIEEFSAALNTVAGGGTVIDPDVVQHLLGVGATLSGSADNLAQTPTAHNRHGNSKLSRLSPRELEILKLMAQGASNTDIETTLFISAATVAKHVGNIFDKLDLPADTGNRRVRAVLAFLEE